MREFNKPFVRRRNGEDQEIPQTVVDYFQGKNVGNLQFFKEINKKLSEYPKLLNSLNNSYKKKGTSNFDEVFNTLNLNIGELENHAIRYRHIPAHGQKMKQKTKDKFPILVAVYRTLLNRCILKSLNYNNDYYDVVSNCNRSIEKSIPEENFNKILEELN